MSNAEFANIESDRIISRKFNDSDLKSFYQYGIIAVTDVRNKSSYKLLENIGMRREVHFIKNAWYKGEYTNEYS